MVIENVSLYGFPRLYDIVCDILESTEIRGKEFGRNLVEIYNQVAINFEVRSLSFMEYFHLKYILQEGAVSEFIPAGLNMRFIKSVYPEISHEARELLRHLEHSDEYSNEDSYYMTPVGFQEGKCNFKVTGADLTMFFKTDPMREFFVKIADPEKFQHEDHTFNRRYMYEYTFDGPVTDKGLEENINRIFLSTFYRSVLQNHDYTDFLSDYFVAAKYFKDQSVLLSINKVFEIGPQNPDLDKYDLNGAIKHIKNIVQKENVIDEVSLTFSLSLDFQSFLILYSTLPKHCFTAIESLRAPFSFTWELTNAGDTTNDLIDGLKVAIQNSYGNNDRGLNLAMMIFGYAPMHCILELTFHDINHYLPNLQKGFKYENVKKTYDLVVNFSKNIYGILTS